MPHWLVSAAALTLTLVVVLAVYIRGAIWLFGALVVKNTGFGNHSDEVNARAERRKQHLLAWLRKVWVGFRPLGVLLAAGSLLVLVAAAVTH